MSESPSTKAPNIVFAIPCYGGMVSYRFMNSMFDCFQLLQKNGIRYHYRMIGNESLVSRARNSLVGMFLKIPEASHLMFIDADIEFSADSVLRLLRHDQDVIGGPVPRKMFDWEGIANAAAKGDPEPWNQWSHYGIGFEFKDNKPGQFIVNKGLLKMRNLGSAFMLIRRDVIESMIDAYPETRYSLTGQWVQSLKRGEQAGAEGRAPEYNYSLFNPIHDPDDNDVYLSEDFAFCRRWQKIGGEIWLDPTLKLNHFGSYNFQGNLSHFFRPKAPDG